ncbi:hypothetical protein CDD83_6165 [Cordyceps sp. RAO-2017]|nr:hypothetical protein CDD83_6165 [Cordyceps sp. RAO-2017]
MDRRTLHQSTCHGRASGRKTSSRLSAQPPISEPFCAYHSPWRCSLITASRRLPCRASRPRTDIHIARTGWRSRPPSVEPATSRCPERPPVVGQSPDRRLANWSSTASPGGEEQCCPRPCRRLDGLGGPREGQETGERVDGSAARGGALHRRGAPCPEPPAIPSTCQPLDGKRRPELVRPPAWAAGPRRHLPSTSGPSVVLLAPRPALAPASASPAPGRIHCGAVRGPRTRAYPHDTGSVPGHLTSFAAHRDTVVRARLLEDIAGAGAAPRQQTTP